jgi:Spy/CpxP family protein refolding chaperone
MVRLLQWSARAPRPRNFKRNEVTMKNPILTAAAIAALSVASIAAQPRGENSFHNGPGGGGTSSAQTTDPATLAARQVSFLTKLLTLTTGQQTQATTIFTAAITANQALDAPETTAKTALAAAIKANNTTAITTQATALGNLHAQEISNTAKADAAFYLLLTADQKTILDSMNDGSLAGIHIPGGGGH